MKKTKTRAKTKKRKKRSKKTADAKRSADEPVDRDENITRIVDALSQSAADEEETRLLAELARAFHFRTPRGYFVGLDPSVLAREILDAHQFMDGRTGKEIRVDVRNSDEQGCTVLRVNMDDQPFILDTAKELFRVLEIPLRTYLHPILQVDREAESCRVVGVRPRTAPGSRESFLLFKFGPVFDEKKLRQIERELRESLLESRFAVEDFFPIKRQLDELSRQLQTFPTRNLEEKRAIEETIDLLRWLLDDHFIFLGYRVYHYFKRDGKPYTQVVAGSGLGVLRDDTTSSVASPVAFSDLPASHQARLRLRRFPIISKSERSSRVHRRVPMDFIEVKQLDADGQLVGEHRILGLFTAEAHNAICSEIPVLRLKLRTVLEQSQTVEGSHEHKEVLSLFNNLPKLELFASPPEKISQIIDEILEYRAEKRVRIFCREAAESSDVAVMALVPREGFSVNVRKKLQAALSEALNRPAADFRLALSDEAFARMHFYFQDPPVRLSADQIASLEAHLSELIRTWADNFLDQLQELHGAARGQEYARTYCASLSDTYRASVAPREAASDVLLFDEVAASAALQIVLRPDTHREGREATALRLLRPGEKYYLSDIMPILTHLGLTVIDEETFVIEGDGFPRCHLHTFRVLDQRDLAPISIDRHELLADAVRRILNGQYQSDSLNTLMLRVGLGVRQVGLLRAYVHLFRQHGAPHTVRTIARVLANHPKLTSLIVEMFEARFHPDWNKNPEHVLETCCAELASGLEEVADIDEDRIFRGLSNLVTATVRTNYYQDGGSKPHIALKIDSSKVPGLPRPTPLYEIFVHNAEMEGIHLRSGRVARGGIRWSDRRDDYRTEVLGLMRAQVTKNSVIVPVGSKGGFIVKKQIEEREALMAEVEKQYRTYIAGLLDLTDNRVGDEIVHPRDTAIHDPPDPYLVVAADRGTAALSDVGNEVARRYDFWLDDAFASGGSHGYDHKRFGITARGAWECVRHHFLELGVHVDRDEFTVVGIGDMSGDVFGNGMLCSEKIRLIGAFDHRDIFLDPDPDAAVSYRERKRLFDLPRSSWQDYDPERISEGGGVYSRQTKKIELSPQARRVLETDATAMSGEELIRALLTAPVDLLYNGGIGTYVKASHETHAEARDEKNDAVRVDASQLRCRVVAEGGNLGLMRSARVEFARRGGRINTDFIDNSGGVDLSDHEVNIKIALGALVRDDKLGFEKRNRLLEEIAPDVCELVLSTNRDQALILSLEETISRVDVSDHLALVDDLIRIGLLDPALDRFPERSELQERSEAGFGLLRPELATLLSFSKIDIFQSLVRARIADTPGFENDLAQYFPPKVAELCGDCIQAHPLREEIVATFLTNQMVYRCGITLIGRLRRDLGCSFFDIARAYRAADRLLEGEAFFCRVEDAMRDGRLPTETAYELLLRYRSALAQVASWIVREWPANEDGSPQTVNEVITGLSRWFQRSLVWLADQAPDQARRNFEEYRSNLASRGVSEELAERVVEFELQKEVPPLVHTGQKLGCPPARVAEVYFLVSNALKIRQVGEALDGLPITGPDDLSAARALREEFRTLVVRLTQRVIEAASSEDSDQAVGEYFYNHWNAVEAFQTAQNSAETEHTWSISTAIILSERLRRLVDAERMRG